jgi:hypothetical protein
LRIPEWDPHNRYGILGWFETAVKFFSCVAGFGAASTIRYQFPLGQYATSVRFAIIAGTALMLLWFVVQPVHRFASGEVFAFLFSILQLLAGGIMLASQCLSQDPGSWFFAWIFLLMLGEAVHLIFLAIRTDFVEQYVAWFSRQTLIILSVGLFVLSLGLVVLQIIQWYATFFFFFAS